MGSVFADYGIQQPAAMEYFKDIQSVQVASRGGYDERDSKKV